MHSRIEQGRGQVNRTEWPHYICIKLQVRLNICFNNLMHKVVYIGTFLNSVKEMGFSPEETRAILMALHISSSCVLSDEELTALTKSFRRTTLPQETLDKLDAVPFEDRSFRFAPYDYPSDPKRFRPTKTPQ